MMAEDTRPWIGSGLPSHEVHSLRRELLEGVPEGMVVFGPEHRGQRPHWGFHHLSEDRGAGVVPEVEVVLRDTLADARRLGDRIVRGLLVATGGGLTPAPSPALR